jgi:hypothetical protein
MHQESLVQNDRPVPEGTDVLGGRTHELVTQRHEGTADGQFVADLGNGRVDRIAVGTSLGRQLVVASVEDHACDRAVAVLGESDLDRPVGDGIIVGSLPPSAFDDASAVDVTEGTDGPNPGRLSPRREPERGLRPGAEVTLCPGVEAPSPRCWEAEDVR